MAASKYRKPLAVDPSSPLYRYLQIGGILTKQEIVKILQTDHGVRLVTELMTKEYADILTRGWRNRKTVKVKAWGK